MAARGKGNVQQLEKIIPFITSKRTFRQDVSELATGVNIFHLDDRFQIDPVEQTIKCHSACTGYMSHRRAPGFDDDLNHFLIVLNNVQRSGMAGKLDVWSDINQSLSNKILPT